MSVRSRILPVLQAVLFATVAAVVVQFIEFKGLLSGAEGALADVYVSHARAARAAPTIVAVAIDNGDFESYFDQSSPLDDEAVLTVVSALANQGPRPAVIAVDLLTDSDSYRSRSPSSDTPVVWTAEAEYWRWRSVNFGSWLGGKHDELIVTPGKVLGESVISMEKSADGTSRDAAAGDSDRVIRWGVPIFPRDDDRAVRRLHRRLHPEGEENPDGHQDRPTSISTFAKVIADQYCGADGSRCPGRDVDADEIFVTYDSSVVTRRLSDLLDCEWPANKAGEGACTQWRPKAAAAELEGAIVLLGGTFAESRDFYDTPIGPNTPGLLVNAHAVRAEISGGGLRETWRPLAFGADIMLGTVIGLVFEAAPAFSGALIVAGAAASVLSLLILVLLSWGFSTPLWLVLVLAVLPMIMVGHALAVMRWPNVPGLLPRLSSWSKPVLTSRGPDLLRRRVSAAVAVVPLVLFASWLSFRLFDYLWLSCVGVVLVGIGWHIALEVWQMNPVNPHHSVGHQAGAHPPGAGGVTLPAIVGATSSTPVQAPVVGQPGNTSSNAPTT